jgi:hypothetical protein
VRYEKPQLSLRGFHKYASSSPSPFSLKPSLGKGRWNIPSSTGFLHVKENRVKTNGGYKELALNFAVSWPPCISAQLTQNVF